MHFEAVIKLTCRPDMNEAGDMLGGRDQASLELYLEGVIE
jgi:hypothetical protein